MHQELNQSSASQDVCPLTVPLDILNEIDVARLYWEDYVVRNNSIVSTLFFGQLCSTITCEICSSQSTKYDAFNNLEITLKIKSNENSNEGASKKNRKTKNVNSMYSTLTDSMDKYMQKEVCRSLFYICNIYLLLCAGTDRRKPMALSYMQHINAFNKTTFCNPIT
jgi:hypothetical protein